MRLCRNFFPISHLRSPLSQLKAIPTFPATPCPRPRSLPAPRSPFGHWKMLQGLPGSSLFQAGQSQLWNPTGLRECSRISRQGAALLCPGVLPSPTESKWGPLPIPGFGSGAELGELIPIFVYPPGFSGGCGSGTSEMGWGKGRAPSAATLPRDPSRLFGMEVSATCLKSL